ncbi:MAG: hypothetical protein VYE53_05680, partial [Planctomycetota bacterium]|nr:hypothetical protein [Planctomycetota bacterium]
SHLRGTQICELSAACCRKFACHSLWPNGVSARLTIWFLVALAGWLRTCLVCSADTGQPLGHVGDSQSL